MGKKLLEKAGLIQLPALPSGPLTSNPSEQSAPLPGTRSPAAGVAAPEDPAPSAPLPGALRSGLGQGAGVVARPVSMVDAAEGERGDGGLQGSASDGAASGGSGSGRGGSARAGGGRARTAPGTMLGFMSAQSAAIQEAEQLRAELARFDGALPVQLLDARQIQPSRWANRHDSSYADLAFEALKQEIAQAGGNVQPIKVRPLPPGVGPSNPPKGGQAPVLYELVYGHRRHRACLELGLPVQAVIEPLSDQDLFVQMERENRARQDLSAWEQGMMYVRALELGLYPSNRQLAKAIGRDLGDVGKALSLARLPSAVVDAFATPSDLQFRWAKPLSDAQQKDPERLLARAQALRGVSSQMQARQIFEHLVLGQPVPVQGVGPSNPLAGERVLRHGGQRQGSIRVDARGRVTVRFDRGLDDAQLARLDRLLSDFFDG